MKALRSLVCLFAVMLPLWSSFPLSRERPLGWFTMDRWTLDEGYIGKGTYSMFQDRTGYLWMGSENGLVRYDGRSFDLFNSQNVSQMRSNDVIEVAQTSDGAIWAGTMDGLLCFRNGQVERFGLEHGLPHRDVGQLYIDRSGRFWLGLADGLAYMADGRIVPVELPGETGSAYVEDILEGPDGHPWVLTRTNILRIDGTTVTNMVLQEGQGRFNALAVGSDGEVWLGTESGLFQTDGHGKHLIPVPLADKISVRALLVDREGCLWIGSARHGVFRMTGSRIDNVSEHDGLLMNEVRCLFEDREGAVWVGSIRGLTRFRETPFALINTADGLPHRLVYCTLADHAGNVWAGTPEGLARISVDGSVEKIGPAMVVQSMARGNRDDILVGTESKGLFRLMPGEEIPVPVEIGTGPREIMCVLNTADDRILVGTLGGIYELQGKQLVPAGEMLGIPDVSIRFMVEAHDELWIGTSDGCFRIHPAGTDRYRIEEGLPSNFIFCIYPDENGIWLGTDQGLAYWKDGDILSYTFRDGLPSNEIYAIEPDEIGQFWLSTEDGVASVSRQELLLALNGVEPALFKMYVRQDGIPDGEGIGGIQQTVCKDQAGRIWIATISGLAVCDPTNLVQNRIPPPIVIQNVRVDEQPVETGEVLFLEPGWRRLTIGFAGLSYLVPERVRFRTMLAGFDTEWIDTRDSTVSFTSLPPGDYMFRVYASNNDGVWSLEPAELQITVVKPWWMNWWFIAFAAIFLAAVLNLIWKSLLALYRMFREWQQAHMFGSFRILDVIGKGGMGTVYRVRRSGHDSTIALKILDAEDGDEHERERFLREGAIGQQIDHPNVVKILETGAVRRKLFVAMEYLDGEPLNRKMERGISWRTSLAIIRVICDTLHDLHQMGIVHRDVKPQNVMVLKPGIMDSASWAADPVDVVAPMIKLLDFGLARIVGATTLTRTGLLAGTVQYVPPEALGGERRNDPSVDFYAAGILLYEMLTGLKPYTGEDPGELIYAVLYRSVTAPHDVVPDLSADLSGLVMEMIEKDPDRRLSDYGEIRKWIDRILQDAPDSSN